MENEMTTMRNHYNLLIMNFLGHKIEDYIEVIDDESEFLSYRKFTVDDLSYDNDWNFLMTVINKIESMGFIIRTVSTPTASSKNYQHSITIIERGSSILKDQVIVDRDSLYEIPESKLSIYYSAILDFIEWYNKKS